MGLFKKNKLTQRRAKPSAGRSLSSKSYYRPARSINYDDKKRDEHKEEKRETATRAPKKLTATKFINATLVVAFAILLFFATTLSSTPDIRIADENFVYREETEYQQKAKAILSENILSRSKLLFRSTSFELSMRQSFPEIVQAEAIVPLGGRDLSVTLSLSEPLATISNGSDTGVIDTQGVLINKGNSEDLYRVRFVTPQENFSEGSRLLTTSEVELLNLIDAEFSSISLNKTPTMTIKEVLFNVSEGQFEISFNEVGYFLKVSTYADPKQQVGGAIATLRSLQDNDELPSRYIDVRVPGRVFVL